MYRLGIDVGGTNTDAVLLDEKFQLVDSVKVPTSSDIQRGIHAAIDSLLNQTKVNPKQISHVMLGTTQCTNAIVECKRLVKVGVIRLGYPATASIEPFLLRQSTLLFSSKLPGAPSR
jgi:N-methylhydantoinase A/oxoprolinase/acetone carboxylase beta subunit